MKKIIDILFGRVMILLVAFFIQIALIIFVVIKFQEYFFYFYLIGILFSVLILLFLINSNMNPSYKIAWIIPIMLFPQLGWIFYALFSSGKFSKVTKKKQKIYYTNHIENLSKVILKDKNILHKLKEDDIIAMGQAKYLIDYGESQIFENKESKYFKIGEEYLKALLEELEKAEKFIFMEYFIISEGKMWDSILDVLKRKVAQGVEVRLIYDDFGCIMTLPKKYNRELEKYGIKCSVFNPANLIFTIIYNNRTHRKITVIDGKVAFTGGINLADEYINLKQRFGHWKDTGIMIKGEGVWGFTIMFLNIWKFLKKTDENFLKYKNSFPKEDKDLQEYDGYIVPFSDSPLDKEIVSSNVFMNLINSATKYIYINTPYLIIDYEMTSALCMAAKRGIDVRIVTPFIPDKKSVFEVTRSNYQTLIESGVRIYEYTPGFIHAKSFVVDDKYAVIGTINLDYRSLYLHFECGVWIYKSKTILDIKQDYLDTLQKCSIYTLEQCYSVSSIRKLYRSILQIFSPLL
ncbi:cardiolipin synthase [uncultured Tyzzerella sp.]|uniref:cardiolipin synthase n=1 Tax=uncultured Tyzzerella sp. TaxID=2321398 RepID=UPI002942510F|nr:cardiolipin synthase [uncultured Tyzzerella sp.]